MNKIKYVLFTLLTIASAWPVLAMDYAPVPDSKDYGLLFWKDGSRARCEDGRRLLCIQTGHYGAVFDVEGGRLVKLSAIPNAPSYSAAAAGYNDLINLLGDATSELEIQSGGVIYRNRGASERWEVVDLLHAPGNRRISIEPGLTSQNTPANKRYNMRIRDYGHYRQIFEVDRLRFESDKGEVLNATVRLVVTSWPGLLRLTLEVVSEHELPDSQAKITIAGDGFMRSAVSPTKTWSENTLQSVSLTLSFDGNELPLQMTPRESDVIVTATDLATGRPLTARYDPTEDAWKVQLTNHQYDRKRYNGLDRYHVRFVNKSDQPRKVRIIFANEMGYNEAGLPIEEQGNKFLESVMGALLLMRDEAGHPTGARIQSSKKWSPWQQVKEKTPDKQPWLDLDPVEYGSWHRHTFMARMPAASEWSGEAVVSHALWGGLPQASYYFLNLYGWGFYSFWDVAIQGSFGESVCYALEGYGPSDVTDLRPLYVASYDSYRRPPFEWTPNHGGANFLHYKSKGRKQYLNTRREMPVCGPNLTRTVFHGRTEDEKIAFEITTMHPRTDDINRSYHRIRYEILEDADFTHLAFFQLGTAIYDYYQPGKLAWGGQSGLMEEVDVAPDGAPEYFRQGIPLEGAAPWWISQHEGRLRETGGRGDQPWKGTASRGLIIREWDAVLGGKKVERPSISFFGSQSPVKGMIAEISPPVELVELKKGDFVEMLVEVILVPKHPEHYLGTNEALKESLPDTADTWKAVYRQAIGNDIRVNVTAGKLEQNYPLEIKVDDSGVAEFEVIGGLAYLPITFNALKSHSGGSLHEVTGGVIRKIDQSDHGNDYWQAEFDPDDSVYKLTFNLELDSKKNHHNTRSFRFESK